LGLPLNPVAALQIAMTRVTRRVDLGVLGPGATRRFLFVAGMGFDAYVASSVHPALKKKLGMAAYLIAIVNCLRNYSFPEFQVAAGGRAFIATSCLACNAKSYGGGMVFCPDARMDDGLLDVLILQGARRLELARFLFFARLKKAGACEWVHRLRIEGPAAVLVQADGEIAGRLAVDISIDRACFPLVVP